MRRTSSGGIGSGRNRRIERWVNIASPIGMLRRVWSIGGHRTRRGRGRWLVEQLALRRVVLDRVADVALGAHVVARRRVALAPVHRAEQRAAARAGPRVELGRVAD